VPAGIPSILNWSGGKDSALCLHRLRQSEAYEVTRLLTTVSETTNRIVQHGVRAELLEQQSTSLGIPLHKVLLPDWPTMETYDALMHKTLTELKREGVRTSIFGDIFLEDLRQYREQRLAEVGMQGVFPLWQLPTSQLAQEFIRLGFRAVVVCVDERHLDKTFCGRQFDEAFLADLPQTVDPCGENGEFHTFVHDGPIFSRPIAFTAGEISYRKYVPPRKMEGDSPTSAPSMDTGFWYCDLIPAG
jgi:uncharacterized protein (TIGR00290 family)